MLEEAGIVCRRVNKVREGRPHVVDMIKNDEVALIVNTTEGKQAVRESRSIRREAVARRVTYYTTVAGARATCDALDHLGDIEVNRLQDLHKEPFRLGVKRTPMTLRGAERLRQELKQLKSEARPNVIKAIAEARAHGDLSENAEYHAAREQQSFIEGRINDIEHRLSNAEVIDVTKLNASGRVVFGSTRRARGSGRRRQGRLSAGRRRRGGHQAWAAVGLLAHCARADRQVRGRRGRRHDARAARGPTKSSPYATCDGAVTAKRISRAAGAVGGEPLVARGLGRADAVLRAKRPASGGVAGGPPVQHRDLSRPRRGC